MPDHDALGYQVFVSDPIPLNVPGHIPNGETHMFSPLATTLIYGENDSVLAEARSRRTRPRLSATGSRTAARTSPTFTPPTRTAIIGPPPAYWLNAAARRLSR